MLQPRVDMLPPAQQRLWPELEGTPQEFVLYGGTALALRLGHRRSEDFDFFSSAPVDSTRLLRAVPYLAGAEVLQRSPDTLTCLVDRGGPVRVSFFGGLTLRRVADPETLAAPAIAIASLLDLAATKAEVVQARAAAKDYLDLDALVHRAGVSAARCAGGGRRGVRPGIQPAADGQGVVLLRRRRPRHAARRRTPASCSMRRPPSIWSACRASNRWPVSRESGHADPQRPGGAAPRGEADGVVQGRRRRRWRSPRSS